MVIDSDKFFPHLTAAGSIHTAQMAYAMLVQQRCFENSEVVRAACFLFFEMGYDLTFLHSQEYPEMSEVVDSLPDLLDSVLSLVEMGPEYIEFCAEDYVVDENVVAACMVMQILFCVRSEGDDGFQKYKQSASDMFGIDVHNKMQEIEEALFGRSTGHISDMWRLIFGSENVLRHIDIVRDGGEGAEKAIGFLKVKIQQFDNSKYCDILGGTALELKLEQLIDEARILVVPDSQPEYNCGYSYGKASATKVSVLETHNDNTPAP